MIGHFSSARQNQTATFLTSARQFTRFGITKDGMITLDMGFNANDEQVWGSTHGGYRFKKLQK